MYQYLSNYDSIRFIYLFIEYGTIISFIYFGHKISKGETTKFDFWKIMCVCLLTYTICEGLRFGRLLDYNHYYYRYIDIGKYYSSSEYEPLFTLICWIMYNIGIPYQGFIMLCSFLLIFSTSLLISDYKKYTVLILLLFLWETYSADNYIRFYLSYSFFIICFYFLKHRKFSWSIFFAICSILCHVGILLIVIITYCLYNIKHLLIPWWLTEILFIAGITLGSVGIFNILTPYLSILNINDRTAFYIENYQNLLSGQIGVEITGLSFTNIVRRILAYSFPIYMLPMLIKQNKITALEGNLFTFGIILYPLFSQVEILDRYGSSFMYFSIIVSPVAYYNFLTDKSITRNKILLISCYISLIANLYPVITTPYLKDAWYYMLYIWDAGTLNTLPVQYFLL